MHSKKLPDLAVILLIHHNNKKIPINFKNKSSPLSYI